MAWAMNIAGAGVPSPNRIVLLRDADGDGVAETKSNFLEGLNSPFGMALIGDKLYVADTDALLRFDYSDGATEIKQQGTKVADLPAGPLNYHWTKSLAASADGSRLYVGVGSNSNAGENGLDWETGPRADSRDRSGDGRGAQLRHRLAQPGRAGVRACKPACCGWWSTSATSSAPISCRIISPR